MTTSRVSHSLLSFTLFSNEREYRAKKQDMGATSAKYISNYVIFKYYP